MDVFFNELQSYYQPRSEFTGTILRKYPEKPERIDLILKQLHDSEKYNIISPDLCDPRKLETVHDAGYVRFIKSINRKDVVPNTLCPADSPFVMTDDASFDQKLGYYFYSVDTPVNTQTYVSAHASASSALATISSLSSNKVAVALTRPPGHHAMRARGGGYCIFNNVAMAAQKAVGRGKSVTILDLDYHHGNGTQDIFYSSDRVQYISIHASDDYPYFWGSKEEQGCGSGLGFNINHPIPANSDRDRYFDTLETAIKQMNDYSPDIVLLSMGFDCYYKDPVGGMNLGLEDYKRIGNMLSYLDRLGIILEGGYTQDLGLCFSSLLAGIGE